MFGKQGFFGMKGKNIVFDIFYHELLKILVKRDRRNCATVILGRWRLAFSLPNGHRTGVGRLELGLGLG